MSQRPHWSVQAILLVQGVALAVFAVASLIAIFTTEGTMADVIGFRMNIVHSALLLAAAVLSMLATMRLRAARQWIAVQAGGFTLWFIFGSATRAEQPQDTWFALDRAGNFGHLGLAVLAIAIGMAMAAPWLTGNRVPGRKQVGDEALTSGVGGSGSNAMQNRQT